MISWRLEAVRWNFSFYFMMPSTVAEKYWLSGIARKESRFLSTGLRTATTSCLLLIFYYQDSSRFYVTRDFIFNQVCLGNTIKFKRSQICYSSSHIRSYYIKNELYKIKKGLKESSTLVFQSWGRHDGGGRRIARRFAFCRFGSPILFPRTSLFKLSGQAPVRLVDE